LRNLALCSTLVAYLGTFPLAFHASLRLRLAVQVLEALLQANAEVYWVLLAEPCARVAQLSSELARRTGVDVARCILRWELCLLRWPR
jgi:hypothetical protein